jgi:hypothetical protein
MKPSPSFGEAPSNNNLVLLSSTSIFKPLIADPKWPRFTLAYRYYTRGIVTGSVFAPNFGAVLPLVRNKSDLGTIYELSIHAGLFALMDIGSNPTRLLNSDYFGGLALSVQKNEFDSLIRIAHTSSHLGDELLLSKQGQNIKRVNLSYETAEIITAYRFQNGLRPYIGLGYIVNAEPKSFKSAELTAGIDYRSNHVIINGYAKPILGFYSKSSKNSRWSPNISIKAGLEFEDKLLLGKALQVLLEFYNGHSMQGQFYKKKENHIGTSLNINF